MFHFPCSQCGLCCRMLRHVPALRDYNRGDGVCRHLDGKLCGIYEDRPTICNAAKMYEAFFKDAMSQEEFIAANLEACRKIAELFAAPRK